MLKDSDKRRLKIFKRYSEHLKIVDSHKLINGLHLHFDDTYICPICLEQFPIFSLNQEYANPLTLEDVPPKTLGGKANILTCKKCNNHCGVKFDHQLTEGVNQFDNRTFKPNTSFPIVIDNNGKDIQGEINVLDDGTVQAINRDKKNHPANLLEYINVLHPNTVVNFKFKKPPPDKKKFSLALLKIGYLMVFEKYGYTLIFDKIYDNIRKQLMFPELDLFPFDYWITPEFPEYLIGVPFIIEKNKKAILAIFNLKTSLSKQQYATYIPFPENDLSISVKNIRKELNKSSQISLEMKNIDFFIDCLQDVLLVQNTIEGIKNR